MTDPRQPIEAWEAFCERLKVAGHTLFRNERPADALTDAEGLRHLSRLVRIAVERSMENQDPAFPAIFQIVDQTRKFGCDNPDTIYQLASIDGAHEYRITGTRGTVDYLSFTTSRGNHATDRASVQTGFLDSTQLHISPDGTFEILLSNRDPGRGNWLPTTSETANLSIRQTFKDRRSEQQAELQIHRAAQNGRPAPLTYAQATSGLEQAAGFVAYCASLFPDWTYGYLKHVNQLPPADQAACLAAGGDPNIYFYRSVWAIRPGEALVFHLPRLPECHGWNLQVDNFWQESMDYRYFRSHLNKHTVSMDEDGSIVAVITEQDPGHPNWLETALHTEGHFAMRYIRATEHIDPVTRLCRVEDISLTISLLKAGLS